MDYEDRLQEGVGALKGGQPERAIEVLGELAGEQPDDWRAHLYLGIAHGMAKHYGAAEQALQRAGELDPRNAAVPFNLGQLAQRQGRNEDAVRCYREALLLDPNHAKAKAALTGLTAAPAAPAVPPRPAAPPRPVETAPAAPSAGRRSAPPDLAGDDLGDEGPRLPWQAMDAAGQPLPVETPVEIEEVDLSGVRAVTRLDPGSIIKIAAVFGLIWGVGVGGLMLVLGAATHQSVLTQQGALQMVLTPLFQVIGAVLGVWLYNTLGPAVGFVEVTLRRERRAWAIRRVGPASVAKIGAVCYALIYGLCILIMVPINFMMMSRTVAGMGRPSGYAAGYMVGTVVGLFVGVAIATVIMFVLLLIMAAIYNGFAAMFGGIQIRDGGRSYDRFTEVKSLVVLPSALTHTATATAVLLPLGGLFISLLGALGSSLARMGHPVPPVGALWVVLFVLPVGMFVGCLLSFALYNLLAGVLGGARIRLER